MLPLTSHMNRFGNFNASKFLNVTKKNKLIVLQEGYFGMKAVGFVGDPAV